MAEDSVASLGFDIDLTGLRAAEMQAERTRAALEKVADATQSANTKSAATAKPAVDANKQLGASATKAADDTVAAAAKTQEALASVARRTTQYSEQTATSIKKTGDAMKASDAALTASFNEQQRKREEAEKRSADKRVAIAAQAAARTKDAMNSAGGAVKDIEEKIEAAGMKGLKLAATGTFATQVFSSLANMATQSLSMFGQAPGGVLGVAGRIGGAAGSLSTLTQETAAAAQAATGMRAAAGGMAAGLFGVAAAGVAAAAALVSITVGVASVEDRFTMTERRIRAANPAIVDTRQALADMFKVAKDNGAAFAEVEQTFETMSRAGSRLGATKEQVTGLVDALFKLSSMGGLEKNEGPRSVQLLGRMLESGKADGQMIRGILERNVLLAREMAAGMGIGVQQLTMLMQTGEVTADKMLAAMLKRIPEINREYEKFGDTMGDAWGRFQSTSLDTVRSLSDILGVSKAIVSVLDIASYLVESTRKGVQHVVDLPQNAAKLVELRSEMQAKQRVEDASRSDAAIDSLARERATSTQGLFNERLYEAYVKDLQMARAEALRTFEADMMTVFASEARRSTSAPSPGLTEASRRDTIFGNAAPVVQRYSQQRTNISVINDDLDKLRAASRLAFEDLERAGLGATDAMVASWRIYTSAAEEANKRLLQTSDILYDIKQRASSLGEAQIAVGDAGSPLVGRTQGFIQQLRNSETFRSRYGITDPAQIPDVAVGLARDQLALEAPNVARERASAMREQARAQEEINKAKKAGVVASAETQLALQFEAFAWKSLGMNLEEARAAIPEFKKAYDELREVVIAGARADLTRGIEEQIDVLRAQVEAVGKGAFAMRRAAQEARRDESGRGGELWAWQEQLQAEQTLQNLKEEIELTEKLRKVAGDAAAERRVQFEDEVRRATENAPDEFRSRIEAAMRAREIGRQGLAVDKDIAALKQQVEYAAEEYRLVGLAGEEYAVQVALLEAKKKLLSDGRGLTAEQTNDYMRQTEILARQNYAIQRRRDDAAEMQRIWTRALEGIQSAFVDTFERIFNGQLRGFSDFADAAKRIFFRMMAEIAAAAIIRPIISPIVQGLGELGIVPQSVAAQYTPASYSGGSAGFGRPMVGSGSGGGGGGYSSVGQLISAQGLGGGGGGGGFNPFGIFGRGGSLGSFLQTPLFGNGGVFGASLASGGNSLGSVLGSSGGVGGGLTIGAGLGAAAGIGSGIFQLASGGGSTSSLVSGIGSMIGGAVSLIPGVGQVAGPIIAIASSLLGGLFKSKPDIKAQGFHDYNPATRRYGGRAAFAQGIAAPLAPEVGNEALKLLSGFGGRVADNAMPPAYYLWRGFEDGRMDATVTAESSPTYRRLLEKAWASGQVRTTDEAQWAARTELWTESAVNGQWAQLPINSLTTDSAKLMQQLQLLILKAGVRDDSFTGLTDTSKTIIKNYPEANIQGLSEALAFGRDTYDQLIRTDEITESERTLKQLRDSYGQATRAAEQYGLAIDGLAASERRAVNKYATDFRQNIEDAILGIKNPEALEATRIGREREKMMREAEYLNDQYAKGLIDSMIDVTKVAELFDLRIKEATSSALSSLETFYRRLSHGDLSGSSPTNTLSGTAATYAATVAQAMAGNSDARRRFESDAEAYLRAQANYGGNDPRYAEVLARVRGDTSALIGLNGGSATTVDGANVNATGLSRIALDQTQQIIDLTKRIDQLMSQVALLLDEQRRRNALAA